MCNNAVDNYAYALQFVPDFHKTKKINNALDTSPRLQYSLLLNTLKVLNFAIFAIFDNFQITSKKF